MLVDYFLSDKLKAILFSESAYIDGTKIESNANKYTFVWKKSIAYYKEKMVEQLNGIWKYAQSIAKEEDDLPPPLDFKVINSESVQQAIDDTLNKVLKDNPEVSRELHKRPLLIF